MPLDSCVEAELKRNDAEAYLVLDITCGLGLLFHNDTFLNSLQRAAKRDLSSLVW